MAETKTEQKVSLGATKVTVWKPSISIGGSVVASCPHTAYGHETEAAAKRCLRSLQAGLPKAPAPKPKPEPKPAPKPEPKPELKPELKSAAEGATQAA